MTRIQKIKDELLAAIKEILKKHTEDIMDLTDCGCTPVIWPSADDQDFNTFTMDRIYLDKNGEITVESSSSDSNWTNKADQLGVETLADIMDFLEENEKYIWIVVCDDVC